MNACIELEQAATCAPLHICCSNELVVASYPGPAQLSVACSTEKRGEPGNEAKLVVPWLHIMCLDFIVKINILYLLQFQMETVPSHISVSSSCLKHCITKLLGGTHMHFIYITAKTNWLF